MTTDRPYRPALAVDAAREELEANAGRQFDPSVVEALLAALDDEFAAEPADLDGPAAAARHIRALLEPVLV